MHFIDKKLHFIVYVNLFLTNFKVSKSITSMDKYVITLGLYLILMISFKIYYLVNVKE